MPSPCGLRQTPGKRLQRSRLSKTSRARGHSGGRASARACCALLARRPRGNGARAARRSRRRPRACPCRCGRGPRRGSPRSAPWRCRRRSSGRPRPPGAAADHACGVPARRARARECAAQPRTWADAGRFFGIAPRRLRRSRRELEASGGDGQARGRTPAPTCFSWRGLRGAAAVPPIRQVAGFGPSRRRRPGRPGPRPERLAERECGRDDADQRREQGRHRGRGRGPPP